MMKTRIAYFALVVSSFIFATTALAQTEVLSLKLSRDYGYGGFNNDIQGLFSMKVVGPPDLVNVEFIMDGSVMGEVSQHPFNLQFSTDNYPLGQHKLSAIGYSTSGQKYESNIIVANFVSASVGNSVALRIIIPILAVVFGSIILSFVVPMITGRGLLRNLPLGAERNYGASGGICPKCHRPFPLPIFSMNLGFSKLARCPFCGKWSGVRMQTIARLREAEKAELEWGKSEVTEDSDEEKLRKDIEDSKYM
jgi:hypothetical protein